MAICAERFRNVYGDIYSSYWRAEKLTRFIYDGQVHIEFIRECILCRIDIVKFYKKYPRENDDIIAVNRSTSERLNDEHNDDHRSVHVIRVNAFKFSLIPTVLARRKNFKRNY